MAWRVSEKAPEINACDAMIAAAVERPTSGSSAHDGAIMKKGCVAVSPLIKTSAPCPK
jgi:hypothetical protein